MLQHPRFNDDVPLALVPCELLALVWWCARRECAREDWLLAFMVGVFSLAAGHLAKFAKSVLITHLGGGLLRPGISYRAMLMQALAVPTLCYVALYFVRRFLGPGPCSAARGANRDPRIWIFLAGMFFLFVNTDFGRPYRYVDSMNVAVGEKGGA